MSKKKNLELVKEMAAGGFSSWRKLPHIAELAYAIVEEFGGTKKFAEAFFNNYSSSDSNATKGRMLDSVIRLIHISAEMGVTKASVEDMTEEELTAALSDFVKDDKGHGEGQTKETLPE